MRLARDPFRPRAGRSLLPTIALVMVGALALDSCRPPTSEPPSAREAYLRYCASCHGEGGRGDGPLATELRTAPTDLTTLAADAGGFDEAAVSRAIDGRTAVVAHGTREMPVWGVVFADEVSARDGRYAGYTSLLTTRALTDYLRSLQQAPAAPEG